MSNANPYADLPEKDQIKLLWADTITLRKKLQFEFDMACVAVDRIAELEAEVARLRLAAKQEPRP